MHDAFELAVIVLAVIGAGIFVYYFAVGVASRLPRIRFEQRGAPTPLPQPETRQGDPKAAQIHPLFEALAKALAMKYEAAAKKVRFDDPNKLGVPLREVQMPKEQVERGPIPDVPAIRWTDDAIGMWLSKQGFQTQYPVHIFTDPTGNLLFSQPLEPEKVYGHIEPPR